MIEKTLTSIDESLKQIVTLLTAQQPTAEPQESQEKKPRAKKVDTPVATVGATVVVDEKKGSPATTTQQTAITAPTATAPAEAASETPWKDVLTAIQELNKSEKPGHGRDGVLAVLKQFGLEGQKVPKLETLGKHAEVLAFVKSLMATDASDDLGI